MPLRERPNPRALPLREPLREELRFGRILRSRLGPSLGALPLPKDRALPLREARGGSSLGGSRSIGERARIMSTGIIGSIGLRSPMESGGADMEALSIDSRIPLD